MNIFYIQNINIKNIYALVVLVITKENYIYIYELNNIQAHFKKFKNKLKFALVQHII